MYELDVICDMSMKELDTVPESVVNMSHLKMLYLDRNQITKLPDDLFQRLPNLSWLDLRDNQLVELPKGIANHQHLENLLLQKNAISKLPNELGFVSKLKVLQLSDNPLVYPPQEVVDRGIDDIMVFLQQEQHKLTIKMQKSSVYSTSKSISSESSSLVGQSPENRTDSGTLKLEVLPTVLEQNLSQRIMKQRQSYLENKCDRDKVHKVIKSPSKTSVHSYYKDMNVRDYLPSQDKLNADQIKEMWLGKLKVLIMDQERILQQEKSMNALKSWRREQSCSIRSNINKTADATVAIDAPYDTNSVYNAYMTRSDPSATIQKALVEQNPKFNKTDVDTVIQDIVAQLTRARNNVLESNDPKERIRNAEQELELIVNLHKKISSIKKSNFT